MSKINNRINNQIYNELGDDWYTARDNPVALLRAESKLKSQWIRERLSAKSGLKILDVGCGAGFTANVMGSLGHRVTGADLSPDSLRVAKEHDTSGTVKYIEANALSLPFADKSFDVVVCLDFLEHVEDPAKVIAECSRVLKTGGQFFYHTFNRNWLSHLIVIKGVEWFVKNTPTDMHVIDLFIKPSELKTYCEASGLRIAEETGIRPKVWSRAFFKMLRTREVPDNFEFEFLNSKLISYLGVAKKEHAQ